MPERDEILKEQRLDVISQYQNLLKYYEMELAIGRDSVKFLIDRIDIEKKRMRLIDAQTAVINLRLAQMGIRKPRG